MTDGAPDLPRTWLDARTVAAFGSFARIGERDMAAVPDVREIPAIDLRVSPPSLRVKPGERITLSWRITNAGHAYRFQQPVNPGVPGGVAVDWVRLPQSGQAVALEGRARIELERSTTLTVAAVGPTGRAARSVTVEVGPQAPGEERKARTWYHDRYSPGPEDALRLGERDRAIREALICAVRGPQVELSINPCCTYTDGTCRLQWKCTCANCCDMWVHQSGARLAEDLTVRSGTRVASYFEAGGSTRVDDITRCLLDRRGDVVADHEVVLGLAPGSQWTWTVLAEDSRGRSVARSTTAWFVPHPKYDACTAGREEAIKAAILELCCCLRNGCVADAPGLDRAIPAFADGFLSRINVATDLSYELMNLDLFTFVCRDVADAHWVGALWKEFTNVVEFQWSPSHAPYLPGLLLHELLHKVGFNGDLIPFYTEAEIERQVRDIVEACFPEMPRAVGE